MKFDPITAAEADSEDSPDEAMAAASASEGICRGTNDVSTVILSSKLDPSRFVEPSRFTTTDSRSGF